MSGEAKKIVLKWCPIAAMKRCAIRKAARGTVTEFAWFSI
jgi:hypothetical protein